MHMFEGFLSADWWQVWLGAFFTLAVLSFLYKENALYRFAEHTLVGGYVAYRVVILWDNTLIPRLRDNMVRDGQWIYLFVLFVGLLLYTRYGPSQYAWLARYPIALNVGYFVGLRMAMLPRPTMVQITAAFRNLWVTQDGSFVFSATVNEWVIFITTLTVLSYFMFTLARDWRPTQWSGRLGRYLLMVGFGASFGNTIAGRITLFLGRADFLLSEWLKIGG